MTFLFVPEPLRVPLSELDRRYEYHDAGKVYHGAPTFLLERLMPRRHAQATCQTACKSSAKLDCERRPA